MALFDQYPSLLRRFCGENWGLAVQTCSIETSCPSVRRVKLEQIKENNFSDTELIYDLLHLK